MTANRIIVRDVNTLPSSEQDYRAILVKAEDLTSSRRSKSLSIFCCESKKSMIIIIIIY